MRERACAVAVGDGFSPMPDLVTGGAEAGDGGEGLGVCGIVVVPDFVGFDGPLGAGAAADGAAFPAGVVDGFPDAIPFGFREESAEIFAPERLGNEVGEEPGSGDVRLKFRGKEGCNFGEG